MIQQYWRFMANKKVDPMKLNKVLFKQDLPIFLNYRNKIECGEYELHLRDNLLVIRNVHSGKVCLVPVSNIACMEPDIYE